MCDITVFAGASWHSDNTIVYGQGGSGPIMRVSANGGTPEALIRAKPRSLGFPQILPGGKSVLYTAGANLAAQTRIMVQFVKSDETKELFAGSSARYLPTGHIIYAMGHNLLAVPFDPGKLEIKGGPVPVVEGIFRFYGSQYALSDSGTLAYIPQTTGEAALGRTLVWVDRQGKEEPLEAPANNIYRFPKISPDGTQVALRVEIGGSGNIWIWDLGRKALIRMTFGEGLDVGPIWTPDGKRIVFYTYAADSGLYWKAADGTGEVEQLIAVPGRVFLPYSWSSDGKILLMNEALTLVNSDIGMLLMDGDRTRKPLLKEERASEVEPMISPDGRWMAYTSNESGHNEVYVRPFPEINKQRWQVSTGGGESPLWSPDGRELFYLSGDSAMAVAVRTEPSFSLGTPKTLFRGTYVRPGVIDGTPWDIHPDGKRFLMIKESGSVASAGAGPRKINIVLNWFEELKERVPVE